MEDFGQSISLTASIKNILRSYPEGTSILKELIQNADDARARTIAFVLDTRRLGTSKLLNTHLAAFQGPALLCYNDAEFTNEDFESIKKIGESLKSESSMGVKTGRFGIGFNSVYHLTDLPSFVSGKYLTMFDPHMVHLDVTAQNPGKRLDLVANRSRAADYADQYQGYNFFGCSMTDEFHGTLFRFPLRSEENASCSHISERIHDVSSIRSLLTGQFYEEASSCILFLKYVELIQVFEVNQESSNLSLLFECGLRFRNPGLNAAPLWPDIPREVDSASCLEPIWSNFLSTREDLSRNRCAMATAVSQQSQRQVQRKTKNSKVVIDWQNDPLLSDFLMCLRMASNGTESLQFWMLCNQLGGPGTSLLASQTAEASSMRLIPWAGVAACLGTYRVGHDGSLSRLEELPFAGKAFCFLPLPTLTNLPVNVNGYFELSSNRRDIWTGKDMEGDGAIRAQWNESLLSNVVSSCYIRMLGHLRPIIGFSASYQHFFPTGQLPSPWHLVQQRVFSDCKSLPFLFTRSLDFSKVSRVEEKQPPLKPSMSISSLFFGNSKEESKSSLVSRPYVGRWLNCNEVLLVDVRDFSIQQGLSDFLQEIGSPISLVSDRDLQNNLVNRAVVGGVVSPNYIRRTIRAIVDSTGDKSQLRALKLACFSMQRNCIVLKYVLDDLFDFTLKRPINAGLAELDKLPFVPLVNETLGRFRAELYDADFKVKVLQLTQMGYSERLAVSQLKTAKGDIQLALSNLLSVETEDTAGPAVASSLFIWIRDDNVRKLFAGAGQLLVDIDYLTLALRDVFENETAISAINIRHLQPRHLLDIIPECLPSTWKNQNAVMWDSLAPTREWVQSIWLYLSNNPQTLDCLIEQDIPIVPTISGEMCNLSRRSVLFLPSASCPDMVISILRKSGARIVDQTLMPSLSFSKGSESGRLHEIIFDDSAASILRAIATLWRGLNSKHKSGKESITPETFIFGEWNVEERRALRSHLVRSTRTSLATLSTEERAMLQSLPIFELFCGLSNVVIFVSLKGNVRRSFDQSNSVVSAFDCSALSTLEDENVVHRSLLWEDFIQIIDVDTENMLRAIGCRQTSISQFYLGCFLPRIAEIKVQSKEEHILWREGLVSLFLRASNIGSRNSDFMLRLSQCACVEVRQDPSNTMTNLSFLMKLPGQCFNPSSSEISYLLNHDELPVDELCRPDVLGTLNILGIKTTLTIDIIVDIARRIDALASKQDESVISKSKLLFEFVATHDRDLFDSILLAEAEERKIVSEEAKSQASSSAGSFSSFFKDVFGAKKSVSNARLNERIQTAEKAISLSVDSLMALRWIPVLSELSSPFMPYLDFCVRNDKCPVMSPSCCCLSSEAWKCSASYGVIDGLPTGVMRARLGWNTEVTPTAAAQQLICLSRGYAMRHDGQSDGCSSSEENEILASVIPQLLQIMQKHVGNSSCMEAVSDILSSKTCIWIGTTFVRPCDTAFRCTIDARPFLSEIPSDLLAFRKILERLGVREEFSTNDFVQVLEKLSVASDGQISTPLLLGALNIAVSIVQLLSDRTMEIKDRVIMIPDDRMIMGRSCDMVFHDAPWLSRTNQSGALASCRFVHPKISAVVAERVGCKSVRSSVLRELGNMTLLEAAPDNGREAFGQSESLTRRLRNILEIYPEVSIIGEMLQNADDAGATNVKIIHCKRQFGTSSLLSNSMSSWQGEALYFYNNAQFTEDDFHHISKIGQGSKLDKLSVTGRFGYVVFAMIMFSRLGFNSVYHVTDLPSFVSGDHVVFLDPHVAYVPGAKSDKPGIRIRFTNNQLQSIFADQFEPFKMFDCDMQSPFRGSLFRFPIRKGELGKRSEISGNCFTTQDISKLIHDFCENISSYLVFMRHVKKIEVFSLDDNGIIDNVADSGKLPQQLPLEFVQEAYSVDEFATSSRSDFQRLTLGHNSKESFYSQMKSMTNNTLTRFIEIRRIFIKRPNEILESTKFIISTGIGGKAARQMACDPANREFKFLPIGSVAAQISDNGLVNRNGKLYCFLPVPVRMLLPAHLNGYFELSANRRDIWYGEDMKSGLGRVKSQWNVTLLKDVIAPLYIDLMLFMSTSTEISPSSDIRRQAVNSLWPNQEVVAPWSDLQQMLFSLSRSAPLLWSGFRGGGWGICKDTFVIASAPTEIEEQKSPDSVEQRLHHILSDEGVGVAILPLATVTALVRFDCTAGEVTASMLRKHFRRADRPHPCLDRPQNVLFLLTKVIEDVQSINNDQIASEFVGLPLVPNICGEYCIIGPTASPSISTASPLVTVVLSWTRNFSVMRRVIADALYPDIPLASSSFALNAPLITVSDGVRSFLNGSALSICTNIRKMNLAVFCDLLMSIIPPEWKAGSCYFVRYEHVQNAKLSNDWNKLFWRIIHEFRSNNDRHNFANMAPIIPCTVDGSEIVWVRNCRGLVLDPTNMLQLPAQISDVIRKLRIPLMHFQPMSQESTSVLENEGISLYSQASKVVRESSGSQEFVLSEIRQFALPASPLPFICCVTNISKVWGGTVSGESVNWIDRSFDTIQKQCSESYIDCIRLWIVNDALIKNLLEDKGEQKLTSNSIFVNPDSISRTQLIEALQNLPVWAFLKNSTGSDQPFIQVYRRIAPNDMVQPEGDCSRELIVDHFIVTANPSEIRLLELMGMRRQTKMQFYSLICVNAINDGSMRIQDETLASLVLDITNNLETLEQHSPGTVDKLKQCRIIPCDSGTAIDGKDSFTFCRANELFDPEIPEMRELLPRKLFPAEQFRSTRVLQSLRRLGIRQQIDCNGILAACTRIQDMYVEIMGVWARDHSLDVRRKADNICETACRLFKSVDENIDKFIAESDSDGLKLWIEWEKAPKVNGTAPRTLGGVFGRSIKSIAWIPVNRYPPFSELPNIDGTREQSFSSHPSKLMLVPANQACHADDVYVCSSSFYCLSENITNLHLKFMLGWCEPIPTEALCKQLLILVSFHESPDARFVDRRMLMESILKIYRQLQSRISEYADIQLMRQVLQFREWIWNGEKFVAAERISMSFNFVNAAILSYYLSVLPDSIKEFSALFECNGVRSSFFVDDFARILFELYKKSNDAPLSDSDATVSIEALNALSSFPPEDVSRLVRGLRERPSTGNAITCGLTLTAIPILDDRKILVSSHDVIYSDAPWMLDMHRKTSRKQKILVCHPAINEKIAVALGLKRLRDTLLQAEIVSLPDLTRYFDDSSVPIQPLDIISDVINVADRLSSKGLSFYVDCNSYPNFRLVHPALANFSNQSLIVAMHGYSISPEELIHLFAPQMNIHSDYFDGKPTLSVGLISLFRYTSCVEVLSGTKYYVVDGRGDVMVQHSQTKKEQKRPEIHTYSFSSSSDSDLYRQFGDQFLPFSQILIDGTTTVGKLLEANQYVPGIILRIPLNFYSESSNIIESKSQNMGFENPSKSIVMQNLMISCKSLSSVGVVCCKNISYFELFMRSMSSDRLSRDETKDVALDDSRLMFRYRRSSLVAHDTRTRLLQNTEWKKKSGLASFFSSGFKPVSQQCTIEVAVDETGWEEYRGMARTQTNVSRWLIVSVLGGGKLPELARDDFGDQLLFPLVSVAVDISDQCITNDTVVPEVGFMGLSSQISGIRMHLDVPVFCSAYSRKAILENSSSNPDSRLVDKMIKWNIGLLEFVYAEIVPDILLQLRLLFSTHESSLYKYWPYSHNFGDDIKSLLVRSRFYNSLAEKELFWNSERRHFFKASNGVFIGKSCSSGVISLFRTAHNLFAVPYEVGRDLQLAEVPIRTLTPEGVRRLLLNATRDQFDRLRGDAKLVLDTLAYCISDTATTPSIDGLVDIDYTIDESQRQLKWKSLAGTALIPLENRELGIFQRESSTSCPFIICGDQPVSGFSSLSNVFVSKAVFDHSGTRMFFKNGTFLKSLCLAKLSPSVIKLYIDRLLPVAWKGCDFVKWDPENSMDHPPKALIFNIWSIFTASDPSTIEAFSEWPLLPCHNQILASCKRIREVVFSYDRDTSLCEILRQSLILSNNVELPRSMDQSSRLSEFQWMSKLSNVSDSVIPEFKKQGNTPSVASTVEVPSSVSPVLLSQASTSSATAESESMGISANQFRDIFPCLSLIGAPVVQSEYFRQGDIANFLPGTSSKLCSKIVQSLSSLHQSRDSIRSVGLSAVEDRGILHLTSCQDSVVENLLQFIIISNRSSSSGLDARDIDNLSSLPIFPNSIGRRVACNSDSPSTKRCLLLRDDIALSTIAIPEAAKDNVLLQRNDLVDLYRQMNVPVYGLADTLTHIVMPEFSRLTVEEQSRTLEIVSDRWSTLKENRDLMNILKTDPFVPTISDGVSVLKKPSELFSWIDRNIAEIFVRDQSLFPVNELRTEKWHGILSDLGLKTSIDGDALLVMAKATSDSYESFCRRSSNAHYYESPDYQALLRNGEALVRYLIDSYDSQRLLNNNVFLSKISKACIAPARKCKSFGTGGHFEIIDVLTPFSQTCLAAKKDLVFTNCITLKESCTPQKIWTSRFGIVAEPRLEVVITHFGNLIRQPTSSLDQWNYCEPINDVFRKIFVFFQDNWSLMDKMTKESFKNAPCIPVGHSLVKPSRIFLRMTENLSPFMFEVPRCFGSELDKLFHELGVRQQPNFQDYSMFLSELQDEMGNFPLNPNELAGSIRVLSLLADSMSLEADAANKAVVYVPDEDSVLRNSKDIYFVDDGSLRSRIRQGPYSTSVTLTKKLSGAVYFLHPDIRIGDRRKIGILNLSESVVEMTDRADRDFLAQIQSARSEYSARDSEMTLRLHSDDLCAMLAQIMFACQEAGLSRLANLSSREAIMQLHDEIRGKLSRTSVVGVPRLQSRHYISCESTLIDVSDSLFGSLFVVESVHDGGFVLLISWGLIPASLDSSFVISMALTKLIGLPVQRQAAVAALIKSDQNERQNISSLFGLSHDPLERLRRGEPGARLTETDAKLLDYKPLHQYTKLEVVAVRSSATDDDFRYGIVTKTGYDDDSDGNESSNASSSSSATALVRRIMVRVSATETRSFLSTDVHTFKKGKDGIDLSANKKSVMNSISTSFQNLLPSPASKPVASIAESKEKSVPVSSVEYTEALRTLMSRAGIEFSPERDNLIGQVVELQRNNEAMREERSLTVMQLEESRRDVDSLRKSLKCGICMDVDIDTVLNPCGHVICSVCVAGLRGRKCPWCRKDIVPLRILLNTEKPA